ncbi:MAG: hypothetical protein WCL49_10125 [bacterium]
MKPLADLMQADKGDGQPAQDQHGNLDDVGIAAPHEAEDEEPVRNRQPEDRVDGQ